MSKCSVLGCKLKSELFFSSPRNEQQLNLWREILNIDEDKFFVCDQHFEDKFVRMKKLGVTSDGYPSLYLPSNDNNDSEICQCCMKSFLNTYFNQADEFYRVTPEFQDIFKRTMECQVSAK